MRALCATALVFLVAAAAPRPSRAAFPDTLGVWTPTDAGSMFDAVPRSDYLRANVFSLDQYLGFAPGGVLVRLGPIGSSAAFSRWGIGRGRASFSINGIPFNDPQNGIAPWVDVATSDLGRLEYETGAWEPSWIEGSIAMVTAAAPKSRPATYLELSKGTNDLRQRRVYFASEEGRAGLDLSYDEVLNDGYDFDASGTVPYVPDYGKARSRNSAIVLRGSPDENANFTFGIRQLEATTTGDLSSADNEGTRGAHLAWLDAAVGNTRLTVYGRGFTTAAPDSETANETAGVVLDTRAGNAVRQLRVRVSLGETSYTQDVGARSAGRVQGGSGVLSVHSRVGNQAELFANGSAAGDDQTRLAWGVAAGARRVAPRQIVSLQAGRSSRPPTLSERYLPAHDHDGFMLAGDNGVDPEHAFEVRGEWEQQSRVLVNRVRASWIRAERSIAFRPRVVGSETWRVASNGEGTPAMVFVEEQIQSEFGMGPLRTLGTGAVLVTWGDRVESFASVPELQVDASLLVGGEMFEATSALYVGAEYLHMGARADYDGVALAAFDVLNLVLQARLLDAHFYLRYYNVLDERYTTYGDYLMTPRTFAYGIEWTLFN